jgi:hypothetical protein
MLVSSAGWRFRDPGASPGKRFWDATRAALFPVSAKLPYGLILLPALFSIRGQP